MAYLHLSEAIGEVSVDAVGSGQDVAVVDEGPATVPLRVGCVLVAKQSHPGIGVQRSVITVHDSFIYGLTALGPLRQQVLAVNLGRGGRREEDGPRTAACLGTTHLED